MFAFLVRRLLSVVAVMVAVAALVFSVFYAFRPERIADGTGYPHQLVHFLDRAFLHADLGRSSERRTSFRPVMDLLKAGIPADISLVVGGLVVGTVMGIALGAFAAQRRGTFIDRGLTGFAAFAMSAPVYWVGAMTVVLVGVTMGTLITNAILLETTFSIPGIFSLMTNALGEVDLAVIEGVAIAGAFLVVVANLLADIVHAWLDPRVRMS